MNRVTNRTELLLCLTCCLCCALPVSAQEGEQSPKPKPTPPVIEGLEKVAIPSGLIFWDITKGTGEQPKRGAQVTVHLSSWLADGKLFDDSRESNEPVTILLTKTIKGLGEGIGSMRVGGKRRINVPWQLAYGKHGTIRIPPESNMIYYVELLGVRQAPTPTPVDGIEPIVTESGLKIWEIKKGTGPSPSSKGAATVHFTRWSIRGDILDTTYWQKRTSTFLLSHVIKGWAEGLRTMKVGGQRRLLIPPKLAYGEQGRPPVVGSNEPIIIEVVLIDAR